MIKLEVTKQMFIEEFKRCGRGEQFSREGLEALFDYLENLSEECNEDIDLDVISLCCSYTETTLAQFKKENSGYESLDEIRDCTSVIVITEDKENDEKTIFIHGEF